MKKISSIFLIFILCLQTSLGYAAFGEVTISKEIELGREFELLVKTRMPIIEDPEIKNYIQSIVDKLLQHVPPQPFTFKSDVILSNAFNAFAAPGGFIMLYSGIIQRFEHESEVAGVLAHEISHITQRHISQQMERNSKINILSLATALAGMALGAGGNGSEALVVGSLAAGQAAMLKYSRIDESESDYLGLNMLISAGYNPYGLIGAFEKMQSKQWQTISNTMPTYNSTHPDLSTRIIDLKSRVLSLDKKIQTTPENDDKFLRVQTLIWARYVDPKQSEIYFKNKKEDALSQLGLAIVNSRLNKVSEANTFFTKALELAPNDPLILREAGIFNFEKANLDLAYQFLTSALKIDPKDYMGQFYLARYYDNKKDYPKAHELFKKVLSYVPTDSEVHSYYGRSLGEAGNTFEAYLHLAYASLYRFDETKIKSWLKRIDALQRTESQNLQLEKFNKLYAEVKDLTS